MIIRDFNPRTDAETVARLQATSFGFAMTPAHVTSLRRRSRADCRNGRVIEDDGSVVASLDMVPKEVYVGRALLTVGGIAGVCTDPAKRMKGYGRILMEHAVEWVREKKYDLCLLYGIPNYYHKFGFEVVMARHFVTISQTDIPSTDWNVRVKQIRKRDMTAVREFYNRHTKHRDGNCRRRAMRLPREGFKVVDSRGRLESYASWSRADGTMLVREAIARDAQAAVDLVQALRTISRREGLGQINIQMPFGYPATNAIAGFNSTYHRVNSFRAGCMGQVSDFAQVARKMAAEWTARLKASEFAVRSARLVLRVGADRLALAWSGRRLSATTGRGAAVSSVTPQRFAQMIFGYRSVAGLSGEGDVKFAAQDLRLLEVLFPERTSFLMIPDNF